MAGPVRANLLLNGGFEDGDTVWQHDNAGSFVDQSSGFCYEGEWCTYIQDYTNHLHAAFYQQFNVPVAGNYEISFYLLNYDFSGQSFFQVVLGSYADPLLVLDPPGEFYWTLFTSTRHLDMGPELIEFQGVNWGEYFLIDNVDIHLVDDEEEEDPEPTGAVPEPASAGLVAAGLAAVSWKRVRRG